MSDECVSRELVMEKITRKLDEKVMMNMLVAIALWTMKILSGRYLKIIMTLLVAIASGNVFAENKITGMRVGVIQIEERAGFRLVVETQSPLKASLSLLQSPYRLVIDMPQAGGPAVGVNEMDMADMPATGANRLGQAGLFNVHVK